MIPKTTQLPHFKTLGRSKQVKLKFVWYQWLHGQNGDVERKSDQGWKSFSRLALGVWSKNLMIALRQPFKDELKGNIFLSKTRSALSYRIIWHSNTIQ